MIEVNRSTQKETSSTDEHFRPKRRHGPHRCSYFLFLPYGYLALRRLLLTTRELALTACGLDPYTVGLDCEPFARGELAWATRSVNQI